MFPDVLVIDFEDPTAATLSSTELHVDSNGDGELVLTFKATLGGISSEDLAYLEGFISDAMEKQARDKNQRSMRSFFVDLDEDAPYHKPMFDDNDDFELLYGSDDI